MASASEAGFAQTPSAATTVRAAFWNIQWFPGRSPTPTAAAERKQIAAVHRDMPALTADVIGLEEVRDFNNATLAISTLPGFKVDVCSTFPPREDQSVGQQVAIASRLTPLSAWFERWKSAGPLTPPRGFAFAAYEIAPRQLLLVYDVHLKSNRGEINEDIAVREEAMRQLIVHMADMNRAYEKMGTLSWLVGGDFNTAPDDPRFARETTTRSLTANGFHWCWENVPATQRHTLPGDKFFPPACFDHIYYRNGRLESARVIYTSRPASDHRAVFASFAF